MARTSLHDVVQSLVLERGVPFVGDGTISLDASTAVRKEERRVAIPGTRGVQQRFAVCNGDKGTWCVLQSSFTWNVAIGSIPRPVASRRESRRSPALIERPALAPSFPISLFLLLSSSLSLFLSDVWLVSCASPVNHGDSYFCTSSSSSATMPDHCRRRDFSRDIRARLMQPRKILCPRFPTSHRRISMTIRSLPRRTPSGDRSRFSGDA